jgi:hypothetical protein
MKIIVQLVLLSLWIQTFNCQDIIINVPQVNLSVNLGTLPKFHSFDTSKIQLPIVNSLVANSNFPDSILNFSGWMSYLVFLLLIAFIPILCWGLSCCALNVVYIARW